jgi:hypothetical protein
MAMTPAAAQTALAEKLAAAEKHMDASTPFQVPDKRRAST